jgi:hypothetical protein
MDWSQTKKITGKCSEDVLLAYFLEKSEKYSAVSHWTASSGRYKLLQPYSYNILNYALKTSP